MPHPGKEPFKGTTSDQFLALLSQLHALHDSELHSLKVEVARLRSVLGHSNDGSDTANAEHTQASTNSSLANLDKTQGFSMAHFVSNVVIAEKLAHPAAKVATPSMATIGNGHLEDCKPSFQLPPELVACVDEKVARDGSCAVARIPSNADLEAPIASQGLEQSGNASLMRLASTTRFWRGLSDDSQRLGHFAQNLQKQASRHDIPVRSPEAFVAEKIEDISEADVANVVQQPSNASVMPKVMARLSNRGEKLEHLPFATIQQEAADTFTWKECLEILVTNPFFETLLAFIIVLNAMTMAMEIQYTGFSVGRDIGYDRSGAASPTWSWAPDFFEGTEMFFGIVFTIELVMKVIGTHVSFYRDPWNWVDVGIVIIWLAGELAQVAFPIDAGMLRVARLVRLLRLLRLVRMIHSFDALYLMTTALKGCVSVLCWACALLLLVQMFIALLLNQYLYDTYFSNMNHDEEDLHMMFEYFGTFSRTMLSMFEITLGNWPPVCRLLSENVSEMFMLLCVVHKLIIGFAVVGVINGVFMQETFKVASIDDRIMLRQKERAIAVHRQKMHQLFAQADTSRDGYLSLEEFREVVGLPQVKTWLGSMELDAADVDNLYTLIDNGDGLLSAQELVDGVARLKGSARSIDMVVFMRDFRCAILHLNRRIADLHSLLSARESGRASF